MSFATEAARWRAVSARDPQANGQFVYSVKSTNIYCRPTCPARLCRRANIGFYKTAAEAEAAGFRACKRCKPQEEIQVDPQEQAVAKACTLIENAIKEDNPKSFRLQDLAKHVGLTPRYFHKIFKDRTGLTPKEYAKAEMAEHMRAHAPPTSSAGQETFDAFDVDNFDFNDLMEFDFDPSLVLDGTVTTQAPNQTPAAMFGQEIDVNIQSMPWSGTFDPNVMAPELNAGSIKHSLQLGIIPIPNSTAWESSTSVIPAVSTFELDAALLLSSDILPESVPNVDIGYTNILI